MVHALLSRYCLYVIVALLMVGNVLIVSCRGIVATEPTRRSTVINAHY